MTLQRKTQWLGAALVAATVLLVFGPMVLRCGLYQDDYSQILDILHADGRQLWSYFLGYVPGRNLHVLFMAALYKATGAAPFWMHAVSLAVDLASVLLLYRIVFRWTSLSSLALPAALVFALMHNHGETHFLSVQFAQGQMAPLFCLLALAAATRHRGPLGGQVAAALGLYTIAFFTYDQVFFLWPLLLGASWFSCKQRRSWRPIALGASYGLALNDFHVLLRHFTAVSFGGRPTIRFSRFLINVAKSAVVSLQGIAGPPPRGALPHWGWSLALAAAAIAAASLILRLWRQSSRAEAAPLSRWLDSPGPQRWMLFGGAWILLAYLPNYFWFISPRHNYLPSIGWALALTGAAGWFLRRRPGMAPAAAFLIPLIAANAIVANVLEGSHWVRAAALHESYLESARSYSAPVRTAFLLGAPRYLGRAPAFNLFHDSVLSLAVDIGVGRYDIEGDNDFAQTRKGVVYGNDISLFPPTELRWVPYSEINAVHYTKEAGFRCLGSLRIKPVSGEAYMVDLRESPACTGTLEVPLEVSLARTSVVARPKDAGTRIAPGLSIAEVRWSRTRSSGQRLSWTWILDGKPIPGLAAIPVLFDKSGTEVYRPIHPSRLRPKEHAPLLWPFYNDIVPSKTWPKGSAIREDWDIEQNVPLAQKPYRIRIEVWSLRERVSAVKIGEASLRLASGR
ncbi:MAG: hypothetical protein V3S11_06230 [Elusimicrobiota bacterium]